VCNPQCIEFVRTSFLNEQLNGARILEVGSLNVNGSPRQVVTELGPAEYIGVDIVEGSGVDMICEATHLVEQFGENAFDAVVSTEMLEHVQDWRAVISNLKRVVRPGGILVVTTRSKGFPLHAYPYDFWRYEQSDLRVLFADFSIELLENDLPTSPGVLVKARKPSNDFVELELAHYRLHSVVRNRRSSRVSDGELMVMRALTAGWARVQDLLPPSLMARVKSLVRQWSGRTC
jgi:SAM-dependent methyltransferase